MKIKIYIEIEIVYHLFLRLYTSWTTSLICYSFFFPETHLQAERKLKQKKIHPSLTLSLRFFVISFIGVQFGITNIAQNCAFFEQFLSSNTSITQHNKYFSFLHLLSLVWSFVYSNGFFAPFRLRSRKIAVLHIT